MSLKDDLRQMVGAGIDEYTIANKTYWSDTQLQAALDRNRVLIANQPLSWTPIAGTYSYASLDVPYAIEPGGGTVRAGTAIVTGWSSARDGQFTFSPSTTASAYDYSGWGYDMNAAAAEVCSSWASAVKGLVDVSSDDQSLKLSQKVASLNELARSFRGKARVRQGAMYRGDAQ